MRTLDGSAVRCRKVLRLAGGGSTKKKMKPRFGSNDDNKSCLPRRDRGLLKYTDSIRGAHWCRMVAANHDHDGHCPEFEKGR